MKTVLITGGASGIGRAFVERLSQQDWRVCALDMNESALAELASDLALKAYHEHLLLLDSQCKLMFSTIRSDIRR